MHFWEGKVFVMIRESSILLWFFFGMFAGRCCRTYVNWFLKKRDREGTLRMIKSPVPELLNGLLWGFTTTLCEEITERMVCGILLSVLFCIAVVDGCVFEIPVLLNGIIAGLGMVRMFTDMRHWSMYVAGGLLAGGIFLLVYVLTGKRGIGGGDMKLMAAAGLFLGIRKAFLALFLGCVMAVVFQLPQSGRKKGKRIFALGPYLAVGIGLMVWFGDIIIAWYGS